LLKREDLQPVFSFKLRGAYNKMVRLPPAERSLGVGQSCTRSGVGGTQARHPGNDRHAEDDAGHQD
jgi:hypothetical protein